MKTIKYIVLMILPMIVSGCYQPPDSRVHMRTEIRSDTLDNNIVTRLVAYAFSALIGEGVDITQALTKRNDAGFLELHISGFNRSYNTKRFRYRVEWLDDSGFPIETKTSVWLPASAMGKSPFSIKVVAPRVNAVNFRMDTKKWE